MDRAVVASRAVPQATTGQRVRDSGLNAAVIRDALHLALMPSRRNLLHWLSWVLTLSVVLTLTAILAGGQVYAWEREITRRLQAVDYPAWLFHMTSNRLTNAEAWEGALIIASVIVILWLLRQRVEAALVVLVFPLHVLGNFPKAIVDRERPSQLFEDIVGAGGGMSFPSGHSEFVVTFYGFLVYLALRHLHGRVQQAGAVLVWLVFIIVVGFGRLAHGRHWPLDVLTGYVIGIGLLSGLVWLHTAFSQAAELGEAVRAAPKPQQLPNPAQLPNPEVTQRRGATPAYHRR